MKARLIAFVAKIDLQRVQGLAAQVRKTAGFHQMQGLVHEVLVL